MSKTINLPPGHSKYSVSIMPLIDTKKFPEVPDEKWLKRDILVPEKDITRIFDKFHDERGFSIGPTSFIPGGVEGVRVYFDSSKKDSLVIVAETKEAADNYVGSLRTKKPYNLPRSGIVFKSRERDYYQASW